MGPIEEALRDKFFPALFVGEEINSNFRKILGHSVKHGGLVIPDPQLSAESAYNTSKVASGELVDSRLGCYALNYVGHRVCVRRASLAARRENMHVDLGELYRQKELAGGQERNRLYRATRNGAWLSTLPQRLNSTELSWEELCDNLRLRYRLMPQDIHATCNGCGERFSIKRALSFPKGGLVMARHDDDENEWGSLGSRSLVPSAITYKPKTNSRTVQGDRTGAGAC